MTDKARELLERAYQYIPMSSVTSQEIRAYLAEPEVKQDEEPVARLHITETDTYPVIDVEVLNGEMLQPSMSPINVYTIQQKPFVRLSEEELKSCFTETNEAEPLAEGWPGLERFARAIEDALEEKNK